MALRMICTVALRSGTDLGVNNARTFVTTGTAMTLSYYIVLKCGNLVFAFVCLAWTCWFNLHVVAVACCYL